MIVFRDMDEAGTQDIEYIHEFLKERGHDNVIIFMRPGDDIEKIDIGLLFNILDKKMKELGISIEKYKSTRLFRILSLLYVVSMQAFKDLHASDGLYVCQKEYKKKFKLDHGSLTPLKEMLASITKEFNNIEKGTAEKDEKR